YTRPLANIRKMKKLLTFVLLYLCVSCLYSQAELWTNTPHNYKVFFEDDVFMLFNENDKYIGKIENISSTVIPNNTISNLFDLDDSMTYSNISFIQDNLYLNANDTNGNRKILKININSANPEISEIISFEANEGTWENFIITDTNSSVVYIKQNIFQNNQPYKQKIYRVNLDEPDLGLTLIYEETLPFRFGSMFGYNDKLYFELSASINYINLVDTPPLSRTFYLGNSSFYSNCLNFDYTGNLLYATDGGQPDAALAIINIDTNSPNILFSGANELSMNACRIYVHNGYIYDGLWRRPIPSTLGLTENNYKTKIEFYPNPAIESLHIKNQFEQINYEIFDINGRKILEGMTIDTIEINVLYSGMYFLKVENSIYKFIKK
uniref:T9SS type A sorting domain-containing protein n=1 Tax=Winogradskyella eximia TaxID=262006 RepID=UPI0024938880